MKGGRPEEGPGAEVPSLLAMPHLSISNPDAPSDNYSKSEHSLFGSLKGHELDLNKPPKNMVSRKEEKKTVGSPEEEIVKNMNRRR